MTHPAPARTILDVMRDLFSSSFTGPSWETWRVVLASLFALPMGEADAELYRRCTGRTELPTGPAREAWLIVGRRGGKSRITALLAVDRACFHAYRLAPGERGIVMVIASDRRQARVMFRYVLALLLSVPMLEALVERQTAEAIHLSNGISIEIHTSSFRAVRGYTVVGAICDEIAFWPNDDAANPDAEVLNALRPAMATVPGAMLVAISSPYARRGEVWKAYQRHFGRNGDVFVWKADTRTMNPTVPASVIESAYAEDEIAASAEYGAEFRRDVESFITREALDAVVVPGRLEIPPLPGTRYVGFLDPSGGSSDAMTIAVGHLDRDRAVLDCVRERRPPFSPEVVAAEFVEVLKSYRITRIVGDRFGGEWAREPFRKAGVDYRVSEAPKSNLYRDVLPLINSGRVELLDHPRLLAQFGGLERRTARGGRDSIDHAPGAHDDVCNAAAGALLEAMRLEKQMSHDLVRFCLRAHDDASDPLRTEAPVF